MNDITLLDWIQGIGPLLFSWPLVILLVILLYREPLFRILNKFTQDDVQKAKIGPFEIQQSREVELEALKFLFNHFLTHFELRHLQKLNLEESFPYEKVPPFVSELDRLRSLNFIKFITDNHDLPDQGELNDFFKVTDEGQRYLDLLNKLNH